MRKRIEENLARLASRKYQHSFVTEATKEEYVLPNEMLDSASSLLETTLSSPTLSRTLNESERDCLARALARFRRLQKEIRFEDPGFSVERDEGWRVVREVANRCVNTMGFDLARWEAENT
jgi:hypothetical protein